MSSKLARTLGIIAALTCSMGWRGAGAAELGFYVGGFYGDASKTIGTEGFDAFALDLYDFVGFTPASTQLVSSLETDNPGYGFVGGYRFTTHLAVEGGYMNIGKVRYRTSSAGMLDPDPDTDPGPVPRTLDQSVSARTAGFVLSALGILPISYRWEVYGRAGVILASNELSFFISSRETGTGGGDAFTGSSTDFLFGGGAGFTFAEIYTLRAEFLRVLDAGDEDTVGEGDVDLLTLGVTVKF